MWAVTDFVLGIDPGAASGFAIVTVEANPRLMDCDFVRLDKRETPTRAMGAIRMYHIVAVAIETQFVALNIKTAIRLAQFAGRWEEACIAAFPDLPVQWIKLAAWQQAMLAGAMGGGRAKREQRKKAAVAVCMGRWGQKLGTDMADAALIAAFVAERLAFDARVKR